MSGLSLDIGKNRVQEPARRRPALPMVALAVLFSLMALLPLGFIIAIGIETGWETIKALVFRPRVAELLSNTLWLTALAVPLCIVTGVAIAWLTERTQLAGRGIWSALAVARWRSRVCAKLCLGERCPVHARALRGRVPLGSCLLSVYLYAGCGGAASP
jgi:hypothetical protein